MESRGKDQTRLLAVATILLCLVFVLLIPVYGTYSGGVDPFIIHAKSGGHHKHQSSINNQTSSSPSPSSPSSNQQSKVTNNVKNMNKQGTAGPLTTTTTAGSSSNSTTTTNPLGGPKTNLFGPQVLNVPPSASILHSLLHKPPVAVINVIPSNTVKEVAQTILFDGSKSYSPDGQLVRLEWTINDNWDGAVAGGAGSANLPKVQRQTFQLTPYTPSTAGNDLSGGAIIIPSNAPCRAANTCKVTAELTVTDNDSLTSKATAVLHIDTPSNSTIPTSHTPPINTNTKTNMGNSSSNSTKSSMKTTTTTSTAPNQKNGGNQGQTTGLPASNTESRSTQGQSGRAASLYTQGAASSSAGPPGTQAAPSMSMWSLSLGKSNFPKEGLRLLANLKPFGTTGVPYILDMSLNLPSGNLSLIAAQITSSGLQHAVVVPMNKTAEGTAQESLYQAELGQTITGINPFTRQPDTIPGGNATDLLLLNNSTSDIAFNDDNGATMTLAYR